MKILVTTDGSDRSLKALTEARKYAEGLGGEITILTVVEYLMLNLYAGVEFPVMPDNEELESVGESVLDNAMELFDGFKGKVNTKLRRGNPADEIIEESKDYDLIFMASSGQGAFSKTILGSVSDKVLNRTRANVFIVK